MKIDYTYCLSEECWHRDGCRRALCNYTDEEKNKLISARRGNISVLAHNDCINAPDIKDTYGNLILVRYKYLDRFINSDRREFEVNSSR